VSGPWRIAVYERYDGAPIYVFSEEHHNFGNCASLGKPSKHITNLVQEILETTRRSHVLVEHFLHATEVKRESKEVCNLAPPTGSLENLRSCLEVLMNPKVCESCKERIHFIDPRADVVCVLPDGNLFKAIAEYAVRCATAGNYNDAVLVLYEAFIHPLWAIFPDKRVLVGRLKGRFEDFFKRLPAEKVETFKAMWQTKITEQFSGVLKRYDEINDKYIIQKSVDLAEFQNDVGDLMILYKLFTNTLLDLWTICVIDTIPKNDVSAILVYFGSLHGLHVEEMLKTLG
ncbi:unnamed protein product, partial [Phaeothamnion confervicola]